MNSKMRQIAVAAAVALLLCVIPRTSTAQMSASAADSAFRRSDWAAARKAYERIASSDTTNAQAWFRLGLSSQSLGEYRKALAAYSRAKGLGFQPVSVRYRIARTYAKLNDADNAFAFLDSAVALAPGTFTPQFIDAEPDLTALRQDQRYSKLAGELAAARYPCRTRKESLQFDFWIGQWDVTPWSGVTVPGQKPGFNDVHPILEHCIVFENWTAGTGGDGKSINYFDINLNKWRQIWMDDSGNPLDYTGEFRDGAMRFTGWNLDAQGRRVEQKLTFTRIDNDTVRQTFEASSDAGKTWAVTFDGRYVRRK